MDYRPKCKATAAAAKSFNRVRLCVTPEMAAHKAPSSLGFSRQEHWSGLPLGTGQILEYNQNLKQLSKDIP